MGYVELIEDGLKLIEDGLKLIASLLKAKRNPGIIHRVLPSVK